MTTLLVLDPADGDRMRAELAEHGFDVRIVSNVVEAFTALRTFKPDLVILDHVLPESGWLLLPKLKGLPAIVCSAQQQQADKVTSLRLGADDFVPKPYDRYELVERINAVLRRCQPAHPAQPEPIIFGELVLEQAKAMVRVNNKLVNVTKTELQILTMLAENAGLVVPLRLIGEKVWGIADAATVHIIQIHVSRLRHNLIRAGMTNPTLDTARGEGYRLTLHEEDSEGDSD